MRFWELSRDFLSNKRENMRRTIRMSLTAIAIIAIIGSIGIGFAFQQIYTGLPSSQGTITTDPAFVQMNGTSWQDLKADGSTSVDLPIITFYDPIEGSKIHPEITISGITADLSIYDYIQITLQGTGADS